VNPFGQQTGLSRLNIHSKASELQESKGKKGLLDYW